MNEKKERKKYLRKSNIYKLLLIMIKPLMLCPSNMRVISSKHSLTLFLQYSLQMIMLVVVVMMMTMMMMGLIDEQKKAITMMMMTTTTTTTTMMIFPKILVPFQLSVLKVKDVYEKQARCSR